MATVKLLVRGSRNPSKIHIRFINGRALDLQCPTGILVDPLHWDNSIGNFRKISSIPDRQGRSVGFEKLKLYIIEEYNRLYMEGGVADRSWLSDCVGRYYKRPRCSDGLGPKAHFVYFSDFVKWWIENKAPTWKTGKNKYLHIRGVRQYGSFLQLWTSFEKGSGKYRICDIGKGVLGDFVSYMEDIGGYAESTVKRHLGRARFFIGRAESEGIGTARDHGDRVFVSKDEEIIDPVLDENEIQNVFDLDLSHSQRMENIRDNAIIGLWTGLRISDFNHHLDVSNIDGDFIKIKTEKTNTWVVIPVHPHIRSILAKRGGAFPVKYPDSYFNEDIKEICRMAGMDRVMRGRLFDPEKKRGVVGDYPKYKLISSHFCRRSFTTNLYGKVPDMDLAHLGGWSGIDMMLHYVKKTKVQAAENLRLHWEEKYSY